MLASGVGAPVDRRVPLSDCPHGLYGAEWGGTGEPVLSCASDLGDGRWFRGRVTAECDEEALVAPTDEASP